MTEGFTKVVTYDAAIGSLPTPSMTGWTFKGWYYNLNDTSSIKESDIYKKTSDITVYAKWEANKYILTFDYQNPTIPERILSGADEKSRELKYGSEYGTLPTPQVLGWTFKGWYTEPNGKGIKVEANNLFSVHSKEDNYIAGNETLYAYWTEYNIGEKDPTYPIIPNTKYSDLSINNNSSIYDNTASLKDNETKILADKNNLLSVGNNSITLNVINSYGFEGITVPENDTQVLKHPSGKNMYDEFYNVPALSNYFTTNDNGDVIIHKFAGWSVYKYATTEQTEKLVHLNDVQIVQLIAEYEACKQLGYNTQTENPSNNELSVYGNNIIKKADEITSSDYKVTLYAIWEEYPVITAKNASLLSTDFNKLDIDSFKDYVLKSVDKEKSSDKEDGTLNDNITTIDIDDISLKNAFKVLTEKSNIITDENGKVLATSGACSITFKMTDSRGNTSNKAVYVWLTASNPAVDVSKNRIRPINIYTRSITREFYNKSEEEGGLLPMSKWHIEDDYEK